MFGFQKRQKKIHLSEKKSSPKKKKIYIHPLNDKSSSESEIEVNYNDKDLDLNKNEVLDLEGPERPN